MSDLIEEEKIGVITKRGVYFLTIKGEIGKLIDDMNYKAPDQKQKTGMWMGTVCSACGQSTSNYYDCDYCPKCGVRMTEI